jgi:phosphatidyl-myo-inositol dimannoside synthase
VETRGRVLFLTSNYPRWPGDTTTPFVHHLAVDLGARGWPVTVLAPHAPGALRRDTIDGVDVRRFRYLLPESAQTVCYGGGALVNIGGSKATLAKVPLLVAAEWVATARLLRARFDVLHAHWVLPQGFVAATVPSRGAARVVTAHGGDAYGLRGALLDRFAQHALTAADAVTVNSAATERALGVLSVHAKVTRIPIGTDTAGVTDEALSARLRSRYRRGSGPLIVFVGRIVADKGIDDLIEAVGLLRVDHPGVRAAIVGTGQHLDHARSLAGRLGLLDHVVFPGWAEPSTVPSWFAAADLVLAPSRVGRDGWQEGQGLSIIEAMAVGRPVIATDTGGIPETIDDGITGVLVPPGRPSALAAAVRSLVADPAGTRAMAERARDSVRQRFSRAASADRFAQLYEQVVTGHRPER